jgi:hypothetical protein
MRGIRHTIQVFTHKRTQMKLTAAARSLIVIVVAVAVLGGGYLVAKNRGLVSTGIIKDSGSNISDYSAVFLTNGQVYFGKINTLTDQELDIDSIYYLQVDQQKDLSQSGSNSSTNAANSNISLVKLGNELHGPNDRMRINRNQVLFTESLKDDSKVVSAIKNYQSK